MSTRQQDTPSSAFPTVATAFAASAARWPENPFLCVLPETAGIYGIASGEITYAQLARDVAPLTEAYRAAGYGHGHRVGILVENRPVFFRHWLALNALGVSLVPINPDLRSAELEYLIGHSDVVAIVAVPPRHAGLVAAAAAIGRVVPVVAPDAPPAPISVPAPMTGGPDADTECALLYSSGTTGRPKGCVLPNEYFLEAGRWYSETGGLMTVRPGRERMLTPLPLFHMNAMACSAMAMMVTGGCLIVLDRFHPATWWQSVCDSRATIVHYLGVMPPMLMGAAEAPADRDHTVRFGFGAGVDRALHARFETRFGFPLIEAWAMTETGNGAVIAASTEPRHVGTSCVGRPDPSIEMRIERDDGTAAAIDEPGELLVRHAGARPGYGFFRRYLKDDDATAAAWAGGWFHTGDVVRQGADGSVYFVDRKKNVIRRSGENIAAVEVESVLLQHPGIRAVAVAPTPDEVRGDEVFACVVAKEPSTSAETREALARDIVAWCLQRLAYYKAPGYVAFVDALPLTSTQKIQRGSLKSLVADSIGTDICVDTRTLKKRVAA
jgi:acyl-CoA synthetase (AMP-forming)/AMP-acid ligase II